MINPTDQPSEPRIVDRIEDLTDPELIELVRHEPCENADDKTDECFEQMLANRLESTLNQMAELKKENEELENINFHRLCAKCGEEVLGDQSILNQLAELRKALKYISYQNCDCDLACGDDWTCPSCTAKQALNKTQGD